MESPVNPVHTMWKSEAVQFFEQYGYHRPAPEVLWAKILAAEYHWRTESFDRRVCSGRKPDGTAMPETWGSGC